LSDCQIFPVRGGQDPPDFLQEDKMKKRIYQFMVLILLTGGLLSAAPTPLLVYSGAGLKKAMQEIKTVYEANHDVTIDYVYAGSAQLLAQIQLSGKGDVFIVGSQAVYQDAQTKKLAEAPKLVAHHTPCIAVRSGNPLKIYSLKDLARPGIKIILGDPKANAIGLSAQKIIRKNGLPGIIRNTVAETATVNELVTQLSMGQADAAIVTEDSIANNTKLERIEIPPEQNIDQIIPVGVVTVSKHKNEAQKFTDFIASGAGKKIFAKHGFKPVD
jgi:molybdate transport system substrate-binding protein